MSESLLRRVTVGIEDAALLILVIFAIPLVILLLGAPLVGVVWLVSQLF